MTYVGACRTELREGLEKGVIDRVARKTRQLGALGSGRGLKRCGVRGEQILVDANSSFVLGQRKLTIWPGLLNNSVLLSFIP